MTKITTKKSPLDFKRGTLAYWRAVDEERLNTIKGLEQGLDEKRRQWRYVCDDNERLRQVLLKSESLVKATENRVAMAESISADYQLIGDDLQLELDKALRIIGQLTLEAADD